MKSYLVSLVGCASLGIAVLVGCAEGAESDPTTADLTSIPIEAGAGEEDETIKLPPPSNPDAPIDHAGDAGASSGGGGNKPDAGSSSGGSSSGGGGGACAAPSPCAGATDLGSISGDTGADVETAQGSTSQWLKVRVTEDDSGVAGMQLWTTATLVSPPGANFDLYVYVPSSDTLACSGASAQSTSTGSTDAAQVKFGETGAFSNGSPDDRTVTIEVRHVSGTCDPSAKWTLRVEGNK